jgi:hypothetical protein
MSKQLKFSAFAIVCALALLVSLPYATLASEDIPLVDGELWKKSSVAEKKSYLVGAGNLMVVEYLYQNGSKQVPSDDQTVVQRMYKATDGVTLDGLIGQIDQWYQKHPDKMKEPVLVVIWHEIVEK